LILSLYKKSKIQFHNEQLIEKHPLRKCRNNVTNEDREYVITSNVGSVIEVIAVVTSTINRVNVVVVLRDTVVDAVDGEYVTASNAGSVIEGTAAGTLMMTLSLPIVGMAQHPNTFVRDTNLRLMIRSTLEIDGHR